MTSLEIRKKFFEFFVKNNHEHVASSSLIPAQDPTLLFANAGMNQFKDLFLGREKRGYTRAVTIQKCVRAGGKHNDLDNVGFTKRHLTFFEMMGNFSFGDYFKKEAIQFAWDFLTKEMNFDISKLHATVYKTDDEAYDLWHTMIGVPKERIHRLGEAENFWQMGDTGPCGPCTELHVDRGPEFGHANIEECGPACDCDRFLEVWNLVFMQFDRQPDGTDKPLKQTGVDTGMGLERLCAIVQNQDSVFRTDLFANILKKIEELSGIEYAKQDANTQAAFHVLMDHIRSSSLLISDGCAPSNEGRGYVLRKIIRRAALFAQKLTDKSIFPELSAVVVADLGEIYPELKLNQKLIRGVLESEVDKFAANLVRGQAILAKYFQESAATKMITGTQAFKLYDTYGFPTELIQLIAKEHSFDVDTVGFQVEMERQQQLSGKKVEDNLEHIELPEGLSTEFTGYQELETSSTVTALLHNGAAVQQVDAGETVFVITKKSPFFIVGGGQVPDQGWLIVGGKQAPLKTVRYVGTAIAAEIVTPIALKVGDTVTEIVNEELRINAMKNHTATHMLQAALIETFGKSIKQSGSLVHPDYLRFDFTYHENLSAEDIKQVEELVNAKIRENIALNIEFTSLKEATKKGALAFFGDKYNPEKVRMIEIPNFSVELCGGTHVPHTGDIGVFKITEVTALAAGHRRIVAVTGVGAVALFQETFNTVKELSQEFSVKRPEVLHAVHKQKEELKALETELKQLKKQLWKSQLPLWQQQVETVGSVPFLFLQLNNVDNQELREIAQQLMQAKPGFYFLTSTVDGRALYLATLAPQLSNTINMKEFGAWLQDKASLRGGGSATSLQGGGPAISATLGASIAEWITQKR